MGIVDFVETLGAIGTLIFAIIASIPVLIIFWIIFWIMGWLQYIYWTAGIIIVLFLISKLKSKRRYKRHSYSKRKRHR